MTHYNTCSHGSSFSETHQINHVSSLYSLNIWCFTNRKETKFAQMIMSLPSNTLFLDDGALQARNWREIVSSTAFSIDKHFPSPSPFKGRPYVIVKRSSSYQGNQWNQKWIWNKKHSRKVAYKKWINIVTLQFRKYVCRQKWIFLLWGCVKTFCTNVVMYKYPKPCFALFFSLPHTSIQEAIP